WAAFADVARLARREARRACRRSPRGARGRGMDRAPLRRRQMNVRTAFFPKDEYFMQLALREAERALEHDDVPIGCVIARDGEVVAACPNERELRQDPTAHCEILALREAAESAGTWRLGAD